MNKTGAVSLSHGRKVTLEVDEIINQQQVVLKQLGRENSGIPGMIAGAFCKMVKRVLLIVQKIF